MPILRVEVTAADLAAGVPKSEHNCPVALACRRQLRWDFLAAVDRGSVSWFGLGYLDMQDWTYSPLRGCSKLPPEAVLFIRLFDKGVLVEPFAFDVEVPGDVALAQGPAQPGTPGGPAC